MQHTRWSVILLVLLLLPLVAYANDELLKLQKDPGQWVMQRKNYAATGYSELNQITADNVKKTIAALQPELGFAFPMPEAGARDRSFRLMVKPDLWGKTVLVNLSGRGDKDVAQVRDLLA